MTKPTDAVPMTGGDAAVRVYAAEAVITMPPDSTLLAVADELAGDQIGLVVLGSMDSVEGVISERDVVRGVADAAIPRSRRPGTWPARRWCGATHPRPSMRWPS